MSIYKEIKRNPTKRDLLSFGVIVLCGFAALAAVFQFRSHQPQTAMALLAFGASVFALSFVPPVGRILYIAWMGLGLTIGLFTSPVIMGLLFVVVIVPVSLTLRIVRRDLMQRKLDRAATTYWEDYPRSDDPASYTRQF